VPILLVVVIVMFFDQLSKLYIQTHMVPGMSIPVVKDVFHITYVLNPGAAFGLFEHQTLFFLIVAVALVVGAIYFYPRIPQQYQLLRFGIGLMVGGAIGNVIDRIKTGYVVDFFGLCLILQMQPLYVVWGVSFSR
jgi:signal peptidase II